jgi:hypothetical protein
MILVDRKFVPAGTGHGELIGPPGDAEFAIYQEGEVYYHCYFDIDSIKTHGRGLLFIADTRLSNEEEHKERSFPAYEWRYFRTYCDNIRYLKFIRSYYQNYGATEDHWFSLLNNPMGFIIRVALS